MSVRDSFEMTSDVKETRCEMPRTKDCGVRSEDYIIAEIDTVTVPVQVADKALLPEAIMQRNQ